MGAGKLGVPENAVVAFALGVDMVNVGREAMMSIGCIQAQKCHTDHCPTGVATQNPWLVRGLDPELKSVRAANYIKSMRRDLWKVSEAMGVVHPGLITPDDVDILDGLSSHRPLREVYGYDASWGRLGPAAGRGDHRPDGRRGPPRALTHQGRHQPGHRRRLPTRAAACPACSRSVASRLGSCAPQPPRWSARARLMTERIERRAASRREVTGFRHGGRCETPLDPTRHPGRQGGHDRADRGVPRQRRRTVAGYCS